MRIFIKLLSLMSFCFITLSCTQPYVKDTVNERTNEGLYLKNVVIDKDTVWEGTILIEQTVSIRKKSVLTIKPGTIVKFVYVDSDKDGLGESRINANGIIIAEGTEDRPIIFTSNNEDKKMGDWYAVQMFYSHGHVFKYCKVMYSVAGLEGDNSGGVFQHNVFSDNIRGMRFAMSKFDIGYNYFINNKYGLWFCNILIPDLDEPKRLYIHHNTITDNAFGIFCRNNALCFTISENNIYNNKRYNITFAIWVKNDVNVKNNFWGETEEVKIRDKIFDNSRSKILGNAIIDPFLTQKINIPELSFIKEEGDRI